MLSAPRIFHYLNLFTYYQNLFYIYFSILLNMDNQASYVLAISLAQFSFWFHFLLPCFDPSTLGYKIWIFSSVKHIICGLYSRFAKHRQKYPIIVYPPIHIFEISLSVHTYKVSRSSCVYYNYYYLQQCFSKGSLHPFGLGQYCVVQVSHTSQVLTIIILTANKVLTHLQVPLRGIALL